MLREVARNNDRIVRFEHPIFLWNVRARTEQSKDLKTARRLYFRCRAKSSNNSWISGYSMIWRKDGALKKLTPLRLN